MNPILIFKLSELALYFVLFMISILRFLINLTRFKFKRNAILAIVLFGGLIVYWFKHNLQFLLN